MELELQIKTRSKKNMELDYMKDIDEMAELIKEKEKELLAMKKEYRERRSEGLRNALEQRKEAEKLVREEMKALGYGYNSTTDYPFKFYF
jgi:aspartate aminotransferase-like enzyme